MGLEVVTKDDLETFRLRLLADLAKLLASAGSKPVRPWLKGGEVRKLLGISDGTLQNIRISGKLKSSKIMGTHYYRYEDIEKMMNNAR
jgi:hypothetical protein